MITFYLPMNKRELELKQSQQFPLVYEARNEQLVVKRQSW